METQEITDLIRILTVEWDDRTADWKYTLIVLAEYESGERRRLDQFTGDAEWAGRISARYQIQIPVLPMEEE